MEVVRRDLLFEIGTEEIPARFLDKAGEDLLELGREALNEARFDYSGIRVYLTPRRLALYVDALAEFQADVDRKVKGPSAKAAFDQSGNPTKACEGFAKSQKVALSELKRITDSSGDYVYAFVHDKGRRVGDVLPGICERLIRGLAFPKNMRWGSSDFRFVRPIRWITLVWGEEAIHFSFEGIDSGNLSRGHRSLGPSGPVSIKNAESYLDAMRSAGVLTDQSERACAISAQVGACAAALDAEAAIDEGLLKEITNIVEWPTAFAGSFDKEFLKLPELCITTPMQGHQRYFPVKRDGKLVNSFIAVRNGGRAGLENIRHGNEKVLAGRLSDAEFFFEDDMKHKLEDRIAKLSGITFAAGLGSMKDKAERVTNLACRIIEAGMSGRAAGEREASLTQLAGKLCKCDLATNMVREFTELQGEIGAIYAAMEGLPDEVSQAIREHYLPVGAGSALPESRIGAALAMADKADSLAGYFGMGQVPTGSADPFALRRGMLGLIAIHEQMRPVLGILEIMKYAVDGIWPEDAPRPKDGILKELEEFAAGRLRGSLLDEGHRYDLVDASMALGVDKPNAVRASLLALEQDLSEGWMDELAIVFVRVRNIARNTDSDMYDKGALIEEAEIRLSQRFEKAKTDIASLLSDAESVENIAVAMNLFASLKPFIDDFFERVMVMCEDKYLRDNRLGLVKSIEKLALRLADFSKISQ